MVDPPFSRIAIVGAGLIGTSVRQAARRAWSGVDVVTLDAGDDLSPVAGADLVVLAAPVRANIALLEGIRARVTAGTVVTDAGSTQRAICAAAPPPPSIDFIGGHPMAGAAKGGADNARPDLFDGRPWILTPRSGTSAGAMARL